MTDLDQFQKLVVQNIYIRQLNLWLDNLNWQNEKKDAIIEIKDKEIQELNEKLEYSALKLSKSEREFKDYITKVKAAKVDTSKIDRQQDVINALRRELDSTKRSLATAKKMNDLLIRQK